MQCMRLSALTFVDYIAWMGTFSAFDQGAFDIFIEHTMAECMDLACPVDACIQCQQNSDLFGKYGKTFIH